MSELEERGAAPSDQSEPEEKYQDLYDNAPDMFVSIDPGTATVLKCNGTVLNKLGYSKEEMLLLPRKSRPAPLARTVGFRRGTPVPPRRSPPHRLS